MKINQDGNDGFTLDVEIYSNRSDKWKDDEWHIWKQARYLVHGIDDSLWTDSLCAVLEYLGEELKRLEVIAPDS